jgi:hypothetical protein
MKPAGADGSTVVSQPTEIENQIGDLLPERVYPVDPGPKHAKRIVERMAEVGRDLFKPVLADSVTA